MKRAFLFAVSAAAIVLGCGSSASVPSESASYESMFGPPASGAKATPDAVYGLWGGGSNSGSMKSDIRVRVTERSTTIAARCSFNDGTVLMVGASAASRVNDKVSGTCFPIKGMPAKCGEVTMLESQSDRKELGDKWCSIDLKPNPYRYSLAGLSLEFESDGIPIELVKISD